ncbi:MAG: ATP-binding domain-containing protein, partial [Anaerotignum sp.]|nr:ATP-binding domain-containing protein [Anaerotignum sp.]
PADNDEVAAHVIREEYRKAVSQYGLEQVQVLTPFRQKSESGAVRLNQALREMVNPCMDKRLEVSSGMRTIRYKDKVMQTKNMNDVSNGDIGFVSAIEREDEFPITVTFSDERIKRYASDEMGCIDLAYAMTIHKSQGQEYECVIIPMLPMFYVMLQRALIYTGITRAKKKVIIVGQKRALFTAIHRNDNVRRNTALAERICSEYEKLNIKKSRKPVKRKEEAVQLTL